MKVNLRTKIISGFLAVSLVLFVFIGFLANYILTQQFKNYTIKKQDQKNKDIISLVSARYSDWGSKWDTIGLESIGITALGEGLILKINDADGNVLWDARVHNNGMCTAIIDNMAKNMQSINPDFKGGYTETVNPVNFNNTIIGVATIGYYGPYFYTDLDVKYLTTLNRLFILGAFIAIFVSVMLGIYLSRQIANPIARVIRTAGEIADGEYKERVSEKSSTLELMQLENSINSLANTLDVQEKLRKQLSSDVAHELRTPITTLKSHLEAMIDGTWKPEAKRLESCHEEVMRMSKIVSDLETLTLYDKDSMMLHPKHFDISKTMARVITIFHDDFIKKSITLDYTPAKTETCAYADEDKISQVFVNILSNALKYTPAGGNVSVSIEKMDSNIIISVSDTGIGISKEEQPYIFERFYRTDKSRTRATGGSGIGLAIVKAILDAHKGSIHVASESNIGSTFTIILPDGK